MSFASSGSYSERSDGVRLDAGVDANPGSIGHLPDGEVPGARPEVGVGVLGIQADLDGVPTRFGLKDGVRQRVTRGDADLPGDDVDPRRHLGDPVLDLEPGVHLEEVVLTVGIQEKLDGRGIVEIDGPCDATGAVEESVPRLLVDRRRGGLLNELLVPPLDTAVPLTEHGQVSVAVAEQLDLDVPGRCEQAFGIDRPIPEGRDCFAPCRDQRLAETVRGVHASHPPSPTAGRCLQHQGEADGRDAFEVVVHGDRGPGTIGTPAASAPRRAASLLPSEASVSAGGPTKVSPASTTARANSAFSDRKP